MKEYLLFHFSSITYAQSAQKMLDAKGISAYLVRTPLSLSDTGCGYCLRIKKTERRASDLIFTYYGRNVKGVYEESPGGLLQRVSL